MKRFSPSKSWDYENENYRNHFTDDGLRHLRGLKNLRQLFVSGTKATDEGCAELKAAIPGLEVHTGH